MSAFDYDESDMIFEILCGMEKIERVTNRSLSAIIYRVMVCICTITEHYY